MMDVITYPCWDSNQSMLVKGGPELNEKQTVWRWRQLIITQISKHSQKQDRYEDNGFLEKQSLRFHAIVCRVISYWKQHFKFGQLISFEWLYLKYMLPG